MRQLTNSEKVLWCFFEHPTKEFTVREIAKEANVPRATVQRILEALRKNDLITASCSAAETQRFRRMKTHRFIERMYDVGLLDELNARFAPSCIILFGSVRKGESNKESDIDLFIETTKKGREDLKEYERKLKHPLQLFLHNDLNDLPEHLRNNIINGIKLEGSFRCENRQRGTTAGDSSHMSNQTKNERDSSSQPQKNDDIISTNRT